MRKRFLLICSGALTVVLALAFALPSLNVNAPKYHLRNAVFGQDHNGSASWWLNIRKNPLTGKVDAEDVLRARQQVETMSRDGNPNSQVLTLNWSELGPDNFGGRTRAILIDRNNANKIYAGGVAGGLWISTNAGMSWTKYNDGLQNLCVSAICQTTTGDIYFGTGEGLYGLWGGGTGSFLGGGVWKSIDNGVTFTRLTATIPVANNTNTEWAAVNAMAADPTNSSRIYAATDEGIRSTSDGGTTWEDPVDATPLGRQAADVEVASNGNVYAVYNSQCFKSLNGDNGTYTNLSTGGNMLPAAGLSRLEIAISPDDANYIYASAAKTIGTLHNIYRSIDAGASWTIIGAGGSQLFEPFGSNAQGFYDNTIAVYPTNKNMILMGGVTLWRWSTTQGWVQVDSGFDDPSNPWYVHSDKHAIKFVSGNPNIVYIGCDGGIFKSINAATTNFLNIFYSPVNRGYNVAQFYTCAYNRNGQEYMGGTQDNGTLYIDRMGNTVYEGERIGGGDGAYCEMSVINSSAFYHTVYYGGLSRTPNKGQSSSGFYSSRIDNQTNLGNPGFASFVTPIALWESLNDTSSTDSIAFINDTLSQIIGQGNGTLITYADTLIMPQASAQIVGLSVTVTAGTQTLTDNGSGNLTGSGTGTINYNNGAYVVNFSTPPPLNTVVTVEFLVFYTAGDAVLLNSTTSNYPFYYTLPVPVNPNQTLMIQDPIQAKLAVGFAGQVWMTKDPLDFSTTPEWIKIAYQSAISQPSALASSIIQTMAWSRDGDHLFVGTEDGKLFRISNLSQVIDSSNGDVANGTEIAPNPGCIVTCTQIYGHPTFVPITSIATDPSNAPRLLITHGNYGSLITTHVWYCADAYNAPISGGQGNFIAKQGTLPNMPVYGSIFEFTDPNKVVLGTEMGVYTCDNIGTPVWTQSNFGLPNTVVTQVRQQRQQHWSVSNTGEIYLATHGRGLWKSTDVLVPVGIDNPITTNPVVFKSSVKVYPNPMSENGNYSFYLPAQEKVSMEVFDMQGRRVDYQNLGKLHPGAHTFQLDISELKAGTYFLSIYAGKQSASAKFIVAR